MAIVFTVKIENSSLTLDHDGLLALRLIQNLSHSAIVGERHSLAHKQPTQSQIDSNAEECRRLLGETSPGSLTVMAHHLGVAALKSELNQISKDRTVVALRGIDGDSRNITFVATGGRVDCIAKISLSSEDEQYGVIRGETLTIFKAASDSAVTWAVLNCHDYTYVDLVTKLLEHQVELLVVVSNNPASRLYAQYAISDVHRLFCFVVLANTAELGGSGVFAPFRRIGRGKHAQLGAGGQVFFAKGPAEFEVDIPLDIRELRQLRSTFKSGSFGAKDSAELSESSYEPMVPSSHFLHTFDCEAGAPAIMDDNVVNIATKWNTYRPRIAIAQLKHIGLDIYLKTKYRIRQAIECAEFEYRLSMRLLELESRCRSCGKSRFGSSLDFLVFPEVFVPRTFLGTLQGFSDRNGTVIVAGVDYPDGGEEANANECVILRPHLEPQWYRKITRSQYDALLPDRMGRMKMLRGDKLVRFVDEENRGFGVLICYDYSHFDLVHRINLSGRRDPLDLLIVVAHNPFGDLYRACCIADCHRFYQYIVMCNVSEYGGSGVFGPERTKGSRQTLLDAGKEFEAIGVVELDLEALHRARRSTDNDLHDGKFMRRPGIFQ
jgi:predicted amidohydrolase